MPLVYSKKLNNNGELAIWHTSESTGELLNILGREPDFSPVKSERRKRELVTSRILAQSMLKKEADIIYNSSGKPSLNDSDFKISVSHTGDFVAVLVHPEKEAGIDIEVLSDRILKIAPKFVSDDEIKVFKTGDLNELYKIWGAKEVVYKIYGRKEVDFKRDLFCTPLDNNFISIKHILPGQIKNFTLTSEILKKHNLVLVYGFDEN